VTLAAEESVRAEILTYLNRLSDFLFVAARVANARAGLGDVPWQKS
jgi:cob(I)alamin adenosyltransferase